MINLPIPLTTFLQEYWQKKPLVIRQALPNFLNPIDADELAGLALEEDIESRLVWETPQQQPQWHLQRGPFKEQDLTQLPQSHWTLLVQGVDRIIPEVAALLTHFNFIPYWRIDDVMISFAALNGSVGPHYDHYDVFLFQAQGQREWLLTSQQCNERNYIPDLELRIMREFAVEQRIILEEGDMLYLPPHIGHYGISRSEACMTYSFGYRSYQGQEILDSLGDYLAEHGLFKELYSDPDWSSLTNPAELPQSAVRQAQHLLTQLINNEQIMNSWFGCFATRLDQQAEQHLAPPLEEDDIENQEEFIVLLEESDGLSKNASCRFAYYHNDSMHLYINGCEWPTSGITTELIILVANQHDLTYSQLQSFLSTMPMPNFFINYGNCNG